MSLLDKVNISLEMYFKIENSKLFNYKTSCIRIKLDNCKNIEGLSEDVIMNQLKKVADKMHIKVDGVTLIHESEYRQMLRNTEFVELEFDDED